MKLSRSIILIFTIAMCLALFTASVIATKQSDTLDEDQPSSKEGKKCRVLVSSGGGDRIFFEYGAFSALYYLFGKDSEETKYNVVTGISAGSLLSGLLSRFPVGEELKAIKAMGDVLFSIKQRDDIIKEWPGGFWEGLTQQSGFFDSSPLLQKINNWIVNKPHTDRELRIGALDLFTGRQDVYHQDSENLNLGILGSCSVPGIFPSVPVTFKNGDKKRYVDGGVKNNFLVEPGIDACLDQGFKLEDIVIDSLLCYAASFDNKIIPDDVKTVESLMRGLEASSFQGAVAKLRYAVEKYPTVKFRYIIQPDPEIGPLPSVGLNFIPAEMQYMYERGMNDTKVQVDKFPLSSGGNAMAMLEKLERQCQDQHIKP